MVPAEIKIGPLVYQVVEVDGLKSDEGNELLGHILYNDLLIKIEKNLAPRVKTVTLWHEIIHGILANAGYMKHYESHIDAISHGMLAVLDDNPDLREDMVNA